jgi:hypothetical protein
MSPYVKQFISTRMMSYVFLSLCNLITRCSSSTYIRCPRHFLLSRSVYGLLGLGTNFVLPKRTIKETKYHFLTLVVVVTRTVNDLGNGKIACKQCSLHAREERYFAANGVRNPAQNQSVQFKIRQTNLLTRGVEHTLQDPIVREKARETRVRLRGVEHALQDPTCLETARQTNLARRGVNWPLLDPEVKEKARQTNIAVRGVEYPAQDPKVREKMQQTMLLRHGVRFANQSASILKRAIQSSFGYKQYTFPNGTVVNVQGYEPLCLKDLITEGIEALDLVSGYDQIPVIKYDFEGKVRFYHPGIFIPSLNKVIEVKSLFTYRLEIEKNKAKMLATSLLYDTELRIYTSNGEVVEKMIYNRNASSI